MGKEKLMKFAGEQCKIFPEDSEMGKYLRETLKILQAEPSEDCVSRKSLIHKLQDRHDFFVDAYGGFINLPQKDKARVDAIANCIAMVVNEPPATLTHKRLLEQEPVLDKIRAEIEQNAYPIVHGVNNHEKGMTLHGILHIIDKYKAGGK